MSAWVFWALVAAAGAGAALYLARASRRGGGAVSREAALQSIYRARLAALEERRAAGELDAAAFEAERAALAEALAAELPESPEHTASARRLPWPVWLPVPLVALAVYLALGRPALIEGVPQAGPDRIEAMVTRLETRLRAAPDDPDGWALLGRSYAALGRPEAAVGAFREAVRRAPDRADLTLDLAEAVARAGGNDLTGEARELIDRALERDPNSLRGRLLRGLVDYQLGAFDAALARWTALLNDTELSDETRALINGLISEASRRVQAAPAPEAPSGEPASVTVHLRLAPALAERVSPEDVLFVFARPAQGGPPLAVEKHRAGALPLTVVLDEADAMMGRGLADAERIVVVARISRHGTAAAQSGDLEAVSAAVDPRGGAELSLEIAHVRP